ncbi:MAG TPA: universal stress protein [Telluria sp.]|nr:universal stress protein [Telluria sp.]
MFAHILMPTDGSLSSEPMIRKCVTFAKEIGAKMTGLYVVPEYQVLAYSPGILNESPERYQRDAEARARQILAVVALQAKEQGVPCDALFVYGDEPYETIIKVAGERGADLICMASHGRRGIKGVLLGSVTQKVLTHSQIPVLVFR